MPPKKRSEPAAELDLEALAAELVDSGSREHYSDAALYDYEYRRRRADVTFYRQLAKKRLGTGGRILDLGCGWGPVGCFLAAHRTGSAIGMCDINLRAVQLAKAEPGTAAIAGELAAQFYGVSVVAGNIQDKADNTTRFFVIGKKPSGPVGGGRDMSSFLISLGDEASAHSGSLLKMLMPLAERGINLSKIESRPSKKRPWDYYFFIDLSGHYEDAAMKDALAELKKFCPMVKWLGSYPAAS